LRPKVESICFNAPSIRRPSLSNLPSIFDNLTCAVILSNPATSIDTFPTPHFADCVNKTRNSAESSGIGPYAPSLIALGGSPARLCASDSTIAGFLGIIFLLDCFVQFPLNLQFPFFIGLDFSLFYFFQSIFHFAMSLRLCVCIPFRP
jgi:hypothetical protein